MVNLGPAMAQRMNRHASQTEPDSELEADEDDAHNPFKSRDWRVVTYTWAGFAVRILIVVGGIFGVLQYLDQRSENRVERTLELVDLWEEPEYQEAQRAIGERIEALNAQYGELLDANASAEDRAVYFDRLGVAAMEAGGGAMPVSEFRAHFDAMLYFLNRMAFCVDGNLCSKDVVDGYFGDFAQSFWAYFGGYIKGQRGDVSPNYGAPLEDYVASLKS